MSACLSPFPERPGQTEDMVHLIARCRATADTRARILPNLLNILSLHIPSNGLLQHPNQIHLTQFILDPASLNLPSDIRISPTHPALHLVLFFYRTLCFAIIKDWSRLLKLTRQTGLSMEPPPMTMIDNSVIPCNNVTVDKEDNDLGIKKTIYNEKNVNK